MASCGSWPRSRRTSQKNCGSGSATPSRWHTPRGPKYDEETAVADTVTMVVQVDGKVRDRIEVSADIGEAEARSLALASPKVIAQLAGAEPARVIVRAPAVVNVVLR